MQKPTKPLCNNLHFYLQLSTKRACKKHDQGSQYASKAFTEFCEKNSITQSMSKAGYPYDEEIYLHHYYEEQELYDAVEDFAYVKYNHVRPHAYNGYRTPFEARYVV